jgi:dTDP-4-dehydrorhamnose 3,5-epimerase
VDIRELKVEGAWEVIPVVHGDARGSFAEWFRADVFEETTGHAFELRQANLSVSVAGTVRGIHFARLPPGQAKWVTCLSGAVLDVVVDIRLGSPTYAAWDAVLLDDVDRRCVYVSEGLGHAYLSLRDGSVFSYLCSQPYAPQRELGIHPLDREVGVEWPEMTREGAAPVEMILSQKDAAAPTLEEAARQGLLPSYDQARAFRLGL